MSVQRFFASCAKGLEYLLADELVALGCTKASATVAGVNAEGDLATAQRAVMWSRLASRILWPIAEFPCTDEATLYAGAMDIDWSRQLQVSQSFAVGAHVSGEGLRHAKFAALRLKDAIVDRLRADQGSRPDVDVDQPDVRFNLVVRKDRAVVSVDLGGEALHRRGWRREQGAAPLKETLAAAVLLRGGWPTVYRDGGALLDPMCGSGTLLIEAAHIAADVAPGLSRHGDLPPTRWSGFDVGAWGAIRDDARARAELGLSALRPVFLGRDIDAQAIRNARANAEIAGIADAMHWEVAAIDSLHTPTEVAGLVVCNPPYDVRLASDAHAYRALGNALRTNMPTWRASLLCGNAELARATGIRAKKIYPMFNGAIECALLITDCIAPVRSESEPRPLGERAQMLANRLRKTLRSQRSWREREQIGNWRAYDADIPEYAAAIDVYTHATNGERWLHVQEYAAPAEIPEDLARRRLGDLVTAARDVLEVPRERVALKTRRIGKGGSKYGQFDQRQEVFPVREGRALLRVNLFDYLDTGLFLDHRPLRLQMGREAKGQRFLNLFCYTGAATVQAALGGAAETTSVDLSATYLQWLADNLRENGIAGPAHRLVQADVMQWLQAERSQFELIFCDPPTFSNSKRAGDFDIQREHVELLQLAMARLAPGGTLYFSNNMRRFKLGAEALSAFAAVEDISPTTIPRDFSRNQRIHRAWRLSHRD